MKQVKSSALRLSAANGAKHVRSAGSTRRRVVDLSPRFEVFPELNFSGVFADFVLVDFQKTDSLGATIELGPSIAWQE